VNILTQWFKSLEEMWMDFHVEMKTKIFFIESNFFDKMSIKTITYSRSEDGLRYSMITMRWLAKEICSLLKTWIQKIQE